MIGVYIVTKNMTIEQHTQGRDRLSEAGAPESAMKLHACFGEDGQLQVFDVWESQEAFDEFLTYLRPVTGELGIELSQPPAIMPIVDLSSNSGWSLRGHVSPRVSPAIERDSPLQTLA